MTDHNAGFRFDIYERVQLPDALPDIGQLQQIELLPRISADPGQEQLLLRGHLELQADYIPGSESGDERTFEHRIPVEISLPVRGELSADGIEVEIDRFDVELSSSRSLNVTGVLSITGLSAAREHTEQAQPRLQAQQQPQLQKQSSGELSGERLGERSNDRPGGPSNELSRELSREQSYEQSHEQSDETRRPKGSSKTKPKQQSEKVTVVADEASHGIGGDMIGGEPIGGHAVGGYASGGQHEAVSWMETDQQEDVEAALDEQQQHESVFAALEKEETKVAFKAKPPEEAEFAGDDRSAQSVRSNNALEWRKLFLGGQSETRFERVRLYIAQREDTIESIADRYELSARDIAVHNQLSESGVSEGQIVYIPSRS